jgi:transcriptional regulator with XRE-family HTH domain
MKRSDLLRSKEYWLVQIQNDLLQVIEDYMQKEKLSRTKLAEKLNVTKGYITQVLNGDFDHKISKLADLAIQCGKVPIISYIDLELYIKKDTQDNSHSNRSNKSPLSSRSPKNHLRTFVPRKEIKQES